MELGGAESALLGLLESIDKSKYSIDLFLMRHRGDLLSHIPDGINLLPEIPEYSCLAVPISSVIKRRKVRIAFGRFKAKRKAVKRSLELGLPPDNGVTLEYSHKYTAKYMPQISEKVYDLAISFLTPHYFAAQKVKAKKKIAWIHTDYTNVAVDKDSELGMWNAYDGIVAIPNEARSSFLKVFPSLADKTVVIENIIPSGYVDSLIGSFEVESEMPDDGAFRILSIGRFSNAKRFDEVPAICRRIRELGIDVKWYLIGFGTDEALIRDNIASEGAEGYVIILGKKENPYPYIKACDLYCQPSRYEGKSVAVREAQMLCKPVVITNYATASSQLEDGEDGVIVPMDVEGCAKGIASVIRDKELMSRLIENTKNRDYTNAAEVNKLYGILE
jgi:glycosyltransferase involved in cell wall biosynthesis